MHSRLKQKKGTGKSDNTGRINVSIAEHKARLIVYAWIFKQSEIEQLAKLAHGPMLAPFIALAPSHTRLSTSARKLLNNDGNKTRINF